VRYKFRGVELRTENAAKPYRQASKWLIDQISQVSSDAVVLDYGCGKFRYTIPLSRRAKYVCAVDSSYQTDREQQIVNSRTNLREFARKYLENVSVYDVHSEVWRKMRFDFILCANVLSVIPHKAERIKVLRGLARVLKPDGRILASTQFRNTHFKKWAANPNANWVRDGWFIKGRRGASFYAIIFPKKLGQLCRAAGLSLVRLGSQGETAFAFAKSSGCRLTHSQRS
jgi:2-polyprenyl-3-methyl-5-hydroxy-6-metoxy-1,4-benzoquinol methylase